VLAVLGSDRVGPTFDEGIHITSGRLYWTEGDFRFQPENGNLPQRWVALPSTLRADSAFPSRATLPASWDAADPWSISRAWLFHSDADPAAVLRHARWMNALLGGALCAVIFLWSASIFGPAGGLLSLGLAAFCPNLLAHAGLATSDTSAALFFTLATLAWWRLAHRLSPGRILAAGLATGGLALAKFSAVLLGPVVLGILALVVARRARLPWCFGARRGRLIGMRRLGGLAAGSTAALGVALIVVWAAYDFRYASSPSGRITDEAWDSVLLRHTPTVGWEAPGAPNTITAESLALRAGATQRIVESLRRAEILPEAWLYGFAYVLRHSQARAAYLQGEYSLTGFRGFFPTAFALKTPEAGLAALALGGIAALTRPRVRRRLAPLLLLGVVYLAFAITGKINIGYRHLLPLLPACWIAAGATVLLVPPRRRPLALVLPVLLPAAQACAALSVWPHSLAYFNAFAGGPDRGHHHLVDSSLDWGQGLPELDRWLRVHHRGEPLHLSYFGSDEPSRFPWEFTRVGDALFDKNPRPAPAPMRGGLYCISATMFHRVYTPYAGPWTAAREARYRELQTWLEQPDPRLDPASGRSLATSETGARASELEALRFARLCIRLQNRPPDALVAHTILVFRLTESELRAALAPGPTAP
jgi:hypothetical protein